MIPWKKIKNHWRNEFNQSEIYNDVNECISVFQNNDENKIVAYKHFYGNTNLEMPALNFTQFSNFINLINTIGEKFELPFKVYLICNRHLSEIEDSKKISSLPNNINYFKIKIDSLYGEVKLEPIDLFKTIQISELNFEYSKPWFYTRGIAVAKDSRFENWSEWFTKNYQREWFDLTEIDRFDDFVRDLYFLDDIYIDERLLGFYLLWKWDEDEIK